MSFSNDTIRLFALKCFTQTVKKPTIAEFEKWMNGNEFSSLSKELKHAVFEDWKRQQ